MKEQICKSVNQCKQEDDETRYFDLMRVVGTKGKYQLYSLVIMSIIGLVNGCISLGSTFFVYVTPYSNCPTQHNRDSSTCINYVCSLPEDQRAQYLPPDALRTLANQFSDYNCQDTFPLQVFQMSSALGGLFGYLLIPLIADNFGRKYSLVLSAAISIIGIVTMIASNGIWVASLGYFVSGFGLNTAFNTNFAFINETVENDQRQVYEVLVQVTYSLGGLINPLYFFIFKDWKIIFYLFYLAPCVIFIILLWLFMRETPQFLIRRYALHQIIEEFAKIASFNDTKTQLQSSKLMRTSHLQRLKDQYQAEMQNSNKQIFNTLDLCRFRSLRFITLCLCFLHFMISFAYYGPQMMIDSFGFNIYIGGVALGFSDVLSFVVLYFFIKQFERRFLALVLFTVSCVLSFVLIFIHRNQNCLDNCVHASSYVEIFLIFAFRFCISLEFATVLIYINQLYPKIIVSIGYGLATLFGSASESLAPMVVGQLKQINFPIMSLFCISSILGFAVSWFLPETFGKAPIENIIELKQENSNKFEQISDIKP